MHSVQAFGGKQGYVTAKHCGRAHQHIQLRLQDRKGALGVAHLSGFAVALKI